MTIILQQRGDDKQPSKMYTGMQNKKKKQVVNYMLKRKNSQDLKQQQRYEEMKRLYKDQQLIQTHMINQVSTLFTKYKKHLIYTKVQFLSHFQGSRNPFSAFYPCLIYRPCLR